MLVDLEFDYDEVTAKMDIFSQADIDTLKHWSLNQDNSKYIPKDLTNKQLVLFYNACYGDIEKSKICIEKYYTIRKNAPEIFNNRDLSLEEMKEGAEVLEVAVLPEKSVQGYDVIYHRLHNTEPSKYSLEVGCKMLIMATDLCLSKRGPQPGYIFLFDMRGVKFGHITRLSLSTLRRFFQYVQEAIPVRMRAVHVLNTEPVLDKLLLVLRPFLDKKLFDMIKFHHKSEDLETFYSDVVSREALPRDHGGTLPDTQTLHRGCMRQLAAHSHHFRAEEEQRAAAHHKHDKTVSQQFKQLDID